MQYCNSPLAPGQDSESLHYHSNMMEAQGGVVTTQGLFTTYSHVLP